MENTVLLSARHDRDVLLERRTALVTELKAVESEISKIEGFIEMYDRYAGSPVSAPAEGQPPLANLRSMTIADGCEAILRAHGGKMRTSEMVRILERAGKLKGETHRGNYASVVQTLQRFPDRFSKVGVGEWTLLTDSPPRLLALR